jgi:hypothetical protein
MLCSFIHHGLSFVYFFNQDKDENYQLKARDNLVEIISNWHPNITIQLVDDHTPWVQGSVPSPLNERTIILVHHMRIA